MGLRYNSQTHLLLLNDLEISLQLGQFEFGAAKPVDSRSTESPFSQLTMHEKALIDYNQSQARKKRPISSIKMKCWTFKKMSILKIVDKNKDEKLNYSEFIDICKLSITI